MWQSIPFFLIVKLPTQRISYYCVTQPASTVTHSELIAKPSKSARKREYLALQALGEQLIALTTEQLHSMALSESLLDAILAAKTITAHGAMRRQKQLIGKLMRNTDPDPIRAAIEGFGENDRMMKLVFRDAEAWRERLTSGDGNDLSEFSDLVGRRNEILAREIANWFSATNDETRKHIRRKIFREIHNELTSKMQGTASTI